MEHDMVQDGSPRAIVRGIDADGDTWYWTGMAGEAWLSKDRSAAFTGMTLERARRKALDFNRRGLLDGLRFSAAPAVPPEPKRYTCALGHPKCSSEGFSGVCASDANSLTLVVIRHELAEFIEAMRRCPGIGQTDQVTGETFDALITRFARRV